MTTVALRGLLGRKLRTVLSSLAIVLGVALISGSLVLTDSIDRAFHSIFSGAYEHTDAVVSARNPLDWSSTTPTVPASLVADIRGLPGVATASGSIVDFNSDSDTAKIIGRDGRPITGSGNPTFGFGIDAAAARFSPLDLVEGRWAHGPGEVVVDAATAEKQGFRVGDRVAVAVDEKRWYRLTGIAGFGGVSSIGGATVAVWDVATAQRLLHKPGRVDTIAIAAKPDVSRAELLEQVRNVLPGSVQVRTAEAQAQQDEKGIQMFVSFIRFFLLGFGAIALFVGSFVIFNALSITVAQRTRELGTLRSLGASRRQVLRSVLLEALAIGTLASAIGLGLGVALAHGLKRVFAALSLDLPTASMALEPQTVVVSLLAGVVLTVVAGVVPARRATRVPAIAAMRDGASAARPRRRGAIVGAVLLVAAVALVGSGLFAHGIAAGPRTLALLAGVLFLFLGTALVASRLVRPVVAIVGAPSRRLGGVSGGLAVENAQRNPSRTASTAAALMVGLALVTFVTVLGKGLGSADVDSLEAQVRSPFVVTSQSGWGAFSTATEAALAQAPGVQTVSGVRFDRARAAGANASVNGIDPQTIGGLLGLEWKSGPPDAATTLAGSEALVKQSFAQDNELAVGDRFELTTPGGETVSLRVKAIFETPKLESMLGGVVVSQRLFDRVFPRPRNAFVLVSGDTSADSLQQALAEFADAKAATRDDWAATRAQGFTQVLNLFYVLLALSVLVSLFGMVNTLALSVFERTRELGMLRAVGMTRRQTRRMIRHESVVTALIGAALGIPLGLGLAAAVATALSKYGLAFTVPSRVLVFVAIAIAAGVLAALLPARRASRLNVLRALQYE